MKNCLTYALRRWRERGGYLVIRRSQLASVFGLGKRHPLRWVPHFLHMDRDSTVLHHYCPTPEQHDRDAKSSHWWAWLRLWHFEGIEKRGDD